ncbi:hypothetical protein [Nocardioides dilutus]
MWRTPAGVVGALLLVAPAGSTASAAGVADPPRYKTYVVCSAKKSAPPATTCGVAKPKTAIFLSKDQAATYKVCVKFPSKEKLCASHQPAKKGVKSGVSITSNKIGKHKVTWFVGGEKVGTYFFTVHD